MFLSYHRGEIQNVHSSNYAPSSDWVRVTNWSGIWRPKKALASDWLQLGCSFMISLHYPTIVSPNIYWVIIWCMGTVAWIISDENEGWQIMNWINLWHPYSNLHKLLTSNHCSTNVKGFALNHCQPPLNVPSFKRKKPIE